MQRRKSHLIGRAKWLKGYLLGEMEALARGKVRGPTFTVSIAKARPSCDVSNIDNVPEDFRRMRVEVDRATVLDHFRSTGEVVPGTVVVTNSRYLRIS